MTSLLGLLIVGLVLLIIFQISRATEFVSVLKDDESSDTDRANKMNALLWLMFLIFFMFGIVWSSFYFAPQYLPEPASEHGMWLRSMFQWTLLPTGIIFVLTHIALFWFAYKYQYNKNRNAVHFADSHQLELIWTTIPAVVMVALVTVGLVNWYKIFKTPPEGTRVIEATAMQFKWEIRYAGTDNELGSKSIYDINSDNAFGIDWEDPVSKDDFKSDTLMLEVGKQVVIKINSLDVLHSFYLPHFRVKMDAVPGIPTSFSFIPTKTTKQYREENNNRKFNFELACAELCGASHWNMRKPVKVVEADEYEAWWNRQKTLYAGENVTYTVDKNLAKAGK